MHNNESEVSFANYIETNSDQDEQIISSFVILLHFFLPFLYVLLFLNTDAHVISKVPVFMLQLYVNITLTF
jgi:hypothetical protein